MAKDSYPTPAGACCWGEQLVFYGSLGLSNTQELKDVRLNCFVRFAGVELS